MEALYKFEWSTHYGDLIGIFVTDDKLIEAIIGRKVCFGDVLGKHSEVYGIISDLDFTLLSTNPEVIAEFKKIGPIGYRPFDYLE